MTENDFDRTARLWLDDGPTQMSDRALQAALDEIHVTRQSRAWWPARRFSSMGIAVRVAAGVAAVLVVAFVGINLFSSRNGGIGGPAPSPTPTPTPTPTPLALSVTEVPSSLEPGTYAVADPFLVPFSVSVPDGWQGNIGGPYFVNLERASGSGAVLFSIFDKVYADPCHYDQGLMSPLPGPTADDLATALARMPGVDATTPTDVTLAGFQGKQLTLTAPASFSGCTLAPGGSYRVWELPLGATNDMTPGERDRVWILDVGGKRLVIEAPEMPGQTAQDKAAVQGVLDSLRIAPIEVTTSAAP